MCNNQIEKKKYWRNIKEEVLNYTPANYTIEVEGIEDDSEYFHPIIKIDGEYTIRGQSDIDGNKGEVYGWDLLKQYTEGMYVKSIRFPLNSLEEIKKILENWEYYKDKILKYTDICMKIETNRVMLDDINTNIQQNLLNDTFLQEDREQCLKKLYDVQEWIENERIIEKYSGL